MINIFALWESGLIGVLMQNGAMRLDTIDSYCKIYKQYRYFRELGHNYIEAVELTAEKLGATESTVKRAVSWAQNTIQPSP